jgi:hypothetical protein
MKGGTSLVEICSFCYRFLEMTEIVGVTEEQTHMMTDHVDKVHHLHPYFALR